MPGANRCITLSHALVLGQASVSAVANSVRQVVNVLDAYAKKDDSAPAEAAAEA